MKFNKILVLLSAIGCTFQSCDKLDNTPIDSIDPSKAFRNVADVNMGVLGTYAPLTTTIIDVGAIVSDEVLLPRENTVSNTSIHKWVYNSGSGSVTAAWYEYYVVIDRINHVLEAIPNIPINANTQSTLDQYHAELLALRAYSHFELLRAYASTYEKDGMGVPYMKKRALSYPPRESVATNFADINADLAAAKELMPSSFTSPIRITKTAISAIQARVALYEKDWANAIKYATEVINNQSLASKTDFPKIWTDGSQSEVIWQLAREGSDSKLGASFFRETGEMVLYAPSFKLISLFNTVDDIRFASYIKYDPARSTSSAGVKSAYLVNKYRGGNSAAPGLTNVKLFRLGEMYLIRSEAELEQNAASGLANATTDLNTLRNARINNYTNQTFANKQSALDAIYVERFKELAFEGHRFYDLKRRSLPIQRSAQDLTDIITKSELTNTEAQYCFPIPDVEMTVNKSMKQNPYYSSN